MELRRPAVMLWIKRLGPVALGIAAGYAYYAFIGCATGTCPITSNPWSSMAYGGLIGALAGPWNGRGSRTTSAKESK